MKKLEKRIAAVKIEIDHYRAEHGTRAFLPIQVKQDLVDLLSEIKPGTLASRVGVGPMNLARWKKELTPKSVRKKSRSFKELKVVSENPSELVVSLPDGIEIRGVPLSVI